jgi:hypothetical protein
MERAMTRPDDNAGSGLDKPEPRTLVEKMGDRLKKIVPSPSPRPAPAEKPDVAPTIMPPAD